MPKTVRVQFTPPKSWSFEDPIRMRRADDIRFVREPGNQPWRFTGAEITPSTPQLTWSVSPGGETLTVKDAYTSMGAWSCVLLVTHDGDGKDYRSDDPQIINEPQMAFALDSYTIAAAAAGALVGAAIGAYVDATTGPVTSRGMMKGLAGGAPLGAIVGLFIGRMLRRGADRA